MGNTLGQLTTFIGEERERFATKHNNMSAFAFAEISRYYRFIGLIHRRHRAAGRASLKNVKAWQAAALPGTHPVSRGQVKLHERGVDLTMRLHLETEGFYLFAKILLDKVARALEFYFGQARGCPLDSHDDLVKGLTRYATGKGIELPGRMLEVARNLKQDIADFRDYQIAHEKSPRTTRGTTWDADGNVRMIMMKIYPTEKDKQKETALIDDLRGDIDEYVKLVMECVRSNRERSRLARAQT